MKNAPNLWRLEDLPGMPKVSNTIPTINQALIENKWTPARPLGYYSIWNRLHLAIMVFTGKADALIWPGKQ